MPRVTFDVHTELAPEPVLAMLTDFSARRPELWPTLTRELYEVYEVGATGADVMEGSPWPTRMWERAYYDWSVPGRVRWTVQESNYFAPGSYTEVKVQMAAAEGSNVRLEWNRTEIGLRGKAVAALNLLTGATIVRRAVFQRAFDRAVRSRSKT